VQTLQDLHPTERELQPRCGVSNTQTLELRLASRTATLWGQYLHPPFRLTPLTNSFSHIWNMHRLHHLQRLSWPPCQAPPARSPTFQFFTPAPSARTVPITSCPGITGNFTLDACQTSCLSFIGYAIHSHKVEFHILETFSADLSHQRRYRLAYTMAHSAR
jgi:hypothetical protein